MTVILQITEIPENETLKGRVLVLPPQGGTLGTAFDCTLQLPDRTQQIAPIHARFIPSQQGMALEPAAGGTQTLLNNRPLVFGRPSKIEDGSVINIGGYTILATESDAQSKTKPQAPAARSAAEQSISNPFSQSAAGILDDADLSNSAFMSSPQTAGASTSAKSPAGSPHFSAKGVFAEDPFGDDPFDGAANGNNDDPFADATQQVSSGNFDQAPPKLDEEIIPIIQPEPQFEEENANWHDTTPAKLSDSEFIATTRKHDVQTFGRLVTMLEESNNRAAQQQTRLFKALDETLNSFLEEFSPEQLEDKFADYAPSRFGRNKKHFWAMYQREFQRRNSKKEFHRLFKAILLDNLQSNDD